MNDKAPVRRIDPPVGVSKDVFRDVVTGAQVAYMVAPVVNGKKQLPDIKKIAEVCRRTERAVSRVVASDEFKAALRERGINWVSRGGISPEQAYAVGILTNPSDKRDMAAKLKSIGISYQTYRSWLKEPVFKSYLHQIGEDMLGEHMADVHTAVARNAVDGNMKAIELYYGLTGRFDPGKQQVQDLQRMVSLLLEAIFRHVQDVNILTRINADFDKILEGKVPQAELYVDGEVVEDTKAIEVPVENPIVKDFDDDIPPDFFDFESDK